MWKVVKIPGRVSLLKMYLAAVPDGELCAPTHGGDTVYHTITKTRPHPPPEILCEVTQQFANTGLR